jgi:hypothetical protein
MLYVRKYNMLLASRDNYASGLVLIRFLLEKKDVFFVIVKLA